MTTNKNIDLIKDITLLYELSLSVGHSFNLDENIHSFMYWIHLMGYLLKLIKRKQRNKSSRKRKGIKKPLVVTDRPKTSRSMKFSA